MQNYLPNPLLHDLMLDTLSCENFGKCGEFSQFIPDKGLMPRGFLGATGHLSDVKIIIVLAEPGHPHNNELYTSHLSKRELLEQIIAYTYRCYSNKKDQLHKNVRFFLDEVFPNTSFDNQLKHAWITEGRLCSIKDEIGSHNDRFCARLHLSKQINLLSSAIVVPFGYKARSRLAKIDEVKNNIIKDVNMSEPINIFALAPPGANNKLAKPSWIEAARKIRLTL